jgi:hypothetical protein
MFFVKPYKQPEAVLPKAPVAVDHFLSFASPNDDILNKQTNQQRKQTHEVFITFNKKEPEHKQNPNFQNQNILSSNKTTKRKQVFLR